MAARTMVHSGLFIVIYVGPNDQQLMQQHHYKRVGPLHLDILHRIYGGGISIPIAGV